MNRTSEQSGAGRAGSSSYRRKGPGGLALAALLTLAAAGCEEPAKLVSGCSADEDCGNPQLFRCEVETATCLCRDNGACANGEVCNLQGYCQAKVGCYNTVDCPQGFFCDLGSSTCLPEGRCASDLHCKAGELCDKQTNLCKPGCKSHGDCRLHETCVCTLTLDDGTETEGPCTCDGERADCKVGVCSSQTCGDSSFCAYGEVCAPSADEPEGLPVCQDDYDPVRKPYCDSCVFSPGKPTCGSGPNFCLIETLNNTNYCGVDCSDGKQCANGYECSDVIVVSQRWQCGSDLDCAKPEVRTNITCKDDAECPNGSVCGKDPGAEEGFCHGKCLGSEGGQFGFCSCVVDDDCFQDTCDTTTRTCSVSKRECDLNGQGCQRIRCVDFGGVGGCHIGQNCAPVEGVTCGDLRTNR